MEFNNTYNQNFDLETRCNQSIGISVTCKDNEGNKKSGIFDPIILKNMEIPCIETKTYNTVYNNQKSIKINIYQGNSKCVYDNLLIGNMTIEDLPNVLISKQQIEISLLYRIDGILNVKVRILENGQIYRTTINTLDIDEDLIDFNQSIDYTDWENYRLAYLVKAVVKYSEEIIKGLNYKESKKLNIVLKKIKKYLFIDNEKMVRKHKKELVYLLSIVN